MGSKPVYQSYTWGEVPVCFRVQEKPQELSKVSVTRQCTLSHSCELLHCTSLTNADFFLLLCKPLLLEKVSLLMVGGTFPPKVSLRLWILGPKRGITNPERTANQPSPLHPDYPRTPYHACMRTPEYSTKSLTIPLKVEFHP